MGNLMRTNRLIIIINSDLSHIITTSSCAQQWNNHFKSFDQIGNLGYIQREVTPIGERNVIILHFGVRIGIQDLIAILQIYLK